MRAPHARYRLYTSWRSYAPFLKNLLFASGRNQARNAFEKRLRAFLNVEAVTTVPMCRTGIYLAVKHLITPGQDVVMSPYTIADVVNMVLAAGGRPVFADIDRPSCNISVESVKPLIRKNTGAVLVTHLHGVAAPIREISSLCNEKGIPVIEDAAQAFGARTGRRRLGTFADAGVYSFGTYKNICTWYGGAVTCKDAGVFQAIQREADLMNVQSSIFLIKRMLQGLATDVSTHPAVFRSFTYWIFRFGFLHDIKWINRFVETELDLSRSESLLKTYLGKMTAAQCQLGMLQLDHIDENNRIRLQKAERYRQGLDDIEGLVLPPGNDGDAIYTYFPVQYEHEDRRNLLLYLARHGCDIGPQHLKNCADLPAFEEFYRDCPNARQTARSLLLLPTYPSYPDRNIDHTIDVFRGYRGSSSD
jgi:perosamine synthetase